MKTFFWKFALVAAVAGGLLLVYLDALVSTTFTSRKWEVPARVFARPLELFPGKRLTADEVAYELELLGYRKVARAKEPGQFSRSSSALEVYSRGFVFPDESSQPRKMLLRFRGSSLRSLESRGHPLSLERLEPLQIGGIYPSHKEDRLLLRLDEVPDSLVAGLLAVEDRGFRDHWGISPTGIARAALANYRAGRVVQGGSTITQQLVKNYYLTRERSLWRKGTEVIMALLLEFHYDKNSILQGYLNEVFLGQDGPRAVHGFGLASRFYFDLPLAQTGIHQQALLVGMVKGPSLYNPLRHPERALKRRNTVLEIMREQGVINDAEAAVAMAMPLGLSTRPRIMNSYPAFLDLVRRQLRQEYREEDLGSRGLTIFTSFDPILQRQAEQSISEVLKQIDPGEELETALVVTSFDNGEVRALLGGRRPRFAGFNRALDAIRPVGSLIKPAVYLTALQDPQTYTLATPISDAPVQLALGDGSEWTPQNFDLESHGDVLLHRALAQSYNQATARLGMELGIARVAETVRALGVERPQPEVPAMVLGAGSLAPIEIAAMYQSIASGGFRLPLRTIRNVISIDGFVEKSYPLDYERVVAIEVMHLLHYALREVVQEGTGRGVYNYLSRDMGVAGKTGTTNDNRDSWFAGFSGDLLAVSWIGRDDNGDTGLTGASGALKVWAHFMSRASRTGLVYEAPQGIDHEWIDEHSGKRSGESCRDARLLPFVEGSQPRERAPCVSNVGDRIREWFQDLF